jgi:two-component system chemotaxis response regulator CheB
MTAPAKPIRVLIVDDSALIRKLLTMLLTSDPDIEVVGAAADPYQARDMIKQLNPDVLTLDIEMPRMDGLSFLEKIMTLRSMPVVMISTLTQANAEVTIRALEIGAVDFVAKPTTNVAAQLESLGGELRSKVKSAAVARVRPFRPRPTRPALHRSHHGAGGRTVFVGASTGGVEAIKSVLLDLPENCPPIVITQHMPERFTTTFAARLDKICAMTVVEAAHGEPVHPGRVYIAPGGLHLEVSAVAGQLVCVLSDGPLCSGHRPSVDVLMHSAARVVRSNAVGVMLTGMGGDGAQGLLAMRQAGAVTIGQDEASSLVYGMPRVAYERGAVMYQRSLADVADTIMSICAREAA